MYHIPDAPTCIVTDASDTAVDAVLQQRIGEDWSPIAFFSKKLQPSETCYSAFDHKLLATYLQAFCQKQQLPHPHRPQAPHLCSARESDRLSPRQIRHLDFISQFTSDIHHIQGSRNAAAIALSPFHLETNALLNPPRLQCYRCCSAQRLGAEELEVSTVPLTSALCCTSTTAILICDIATGTSCPLSQLPFGVRRIIPFTLCHTPVSLPVSSSSLHALSGHGSTMMFACGPEHVYSVSTPRCINILSHPYQSLPARRSDHMHIDLDGLLPPSKGYTYLLTCIDCFIHWPEAIPMPDITAETVAQAVISGCIARFGTPSTISTDRGRQFESKLLTHLVQPLSTKCIHSIVHHPIANGLVERLHRWFKASLKTQSDPTNWTDSVPMVLLGIHTAVHMKTSAALLQSSCMVPHSACGSVLQCLFLRHQPYFIHTAPQVYHAAASCSTC